MGWKDIDSKENQKNNGFGVATSRELFSIKITSVLESHVFSYSLRLTFDLGELRENKSVGQLSEEHNRQKPWTPPRSESQRYPSQSQNHRTIWVGRDLKHHLVPTSLAQAGTYSTRLGWSKPHLALP